MFYGKKKKKKKKKEEKVQEGVRGGEKTRGDGRNRVKY